MFRLQRLDKIDSTNAVVKRAIEEGEPEGFAVRARCQTGGYGRQGRTWSSPVGGMYQSLLLRPQVALQQLPTLGPVVALAIRGALLRVGGISSADVQVKWPNDVVCDKGKLAGISAETHAGGVCIGIGVNVAHPAVERPVGGKYEPAYLSSLHAGEKGASDLVDRVGDAVLSEIERRYRTWCAEGFAPFMNEFNACDWLRGHAVQMAHPDGAAFLEGKAEGVDEQARLLVSAPDGLHTVTSGEAHII